MKNSCVYFIFALLLLTGCATTEVSTTFEDISVNNKKPAGTIVAENYGYYLFGYLPICAGNPDKPNETSMTIFEDTVSIQNNQKMLNLEAKKLNSNEITDVRHSTYWTGSFSLWIIWKQVLSSNALAIKNKQPNQ